MSVNPVSFSSKDLETLKEGLKEPPINNEVAKLSKKLFEAMGSETGTVHLSDAMDTTTL